MLLPSLSFRLERIARNGEISDLGAKSRFLQSGFNELGASVEMTKYKYRGLGPSLKTQPRKF